MIAKSILATRWMRASLAAFADIQRLLKQVSIELDEKQQA
tara:strand:+ start:116 stop:235 length:120 start_codon:yes stop_codon:yes gene_type:complete